MVAQQKVSYNLLRDTLTDNGKLGIATVQKILKELDKKGVTGYLPGKSRNRQVLLNPDGTKKDGILLGKKWRKHKRKQKGRKATTAVAKPVRTGKAIQRFSTPDKLRKLEELANASGPRSAALLREIAEDIRSGGTAHPLVAALSD